MLTATEDDRDLDRVHDAVLDYRTRGRCAKRQVLAVAIVAGRVVIGENRVARPQTTCPRANMETGIGYEMCATVCGQEGHAEIDLIREAGGQLAGATVYLFGHHYVCDDCKRALLEAGSGKIVIVWDGKPRGAA